MEYTIATIIDQEFYPLMGEELDNIEREGAKDVEVLLL